MQGKPKAIELFKELLEEKGFQVTIWQDIETKIKNMPPEEQRQALSNVYAQKRPDR